MKILYILREKLKRNNPLIIAVVGMLLYGFIAIGHLSQRTYYIYCIIAGVVAAIIQHKISAEE